MATGLHNIINSIHGVQANCLLLLAFMACFLYNASVKYPIFAAGKYSYRVSEHPEAELVFGCFFAFQDRNKIIHREHHAHKAHGAFAACAFLYRYPSGVAAQIRKGAEE